MNYEYKRLMESHTLHTVSMIGLNGGTLEGEVRRIVEYRKYIRRQVLRYECIAVAVVLQTCYKLQSPDRHRWRE